MMEWLDAKKIIQAKIKTGLDVNTASSTFRSIKAVDAPIESGSYGYQNQRGFVVQIGKDSSITIPWVVLQVCYQMLQSAEGYSGKSFRKDFARQAKNHPCHVHVIGQIFVKAGLAEEKSDVYWPL